MVERARRRRGARMGRKVGSRPSEGPDIILETESTSAERDGTAER
jgi:hypothetical protein